MDKIYAIVTINIVTIIFMALSAVGIPAVMLCLCAAPVEQTMLTTASTTAVMFLTSMVASCAIINLER